MTRWQAGGSAAVARPVRVVGVLAEVTGGDALPFTLSRPAAIIAVVLLLLEPARATARSL